MEGPSEPRYIDGVEIVYGERSSCDVKGWVCEKCLWENKSIRMLIFDIAPYYCGRCKEPNPTDFCICLAYVMINGIPIIMEVKKQQPGEEECVSYALSHLGEIMNRICVGYSSETPDLEKSTSTLDSEVLFVPYNWQFPRTENTKRPRAGGIHKMFQMLQRFIRGDGVPMKYQTADGEVVHYFLGSQIHVIPCDDFEEVCRQIADGNAILAPFTVGVTYPNLEFCQFYTAVPSITIASRKALKLETPSHMVVLIGALSEKGRRAYIGLDSAGKTWCKQIGKDEGWWPWSLFNQEEEHTFGGFGKITAESDFLTNFFMVSRKNDYDVPPKKYDIDDAIVPALEEVPKMELACLPEVEGDLDISGMNEHLIYYGDCFKRRHERLVSAGFPGLWV